jgi:hypothetical protein
MWCKRCQQDVPSIADGDGGTVCVRCGATVRLPAGAARVDDVRSFASGDSTTKDEGPPVVDDWQLDEQLRAAERLLHAITPGIGPTPEHAPMPTAWSESRVDSTSSAVPRESPSEAKPRGGLVAWSLALLGTAALVCGGVLVAWSLVAARTGLWNLGLPILLGGQAALLLGVVLHLERMWRNARAAGERLAEVDHELSDLRQTTSLLGNTHGAGSTTFFAHLAEGASPHLLLADLKGQMDLLAMKVAGRR